MSASSASQQYPARRRFRAPWWLLVLLFVVMPLVELFILIQVGQVIGPWWTIGLLLLDSIIGSWLVKREGGRAWRALTTALGSGRMPAAELADGALILIGGTMMIAPGFVSDAIGFFLILPFTRPIARRLLTAVVTRKLLGASYGGSPRNDTRPGPQSDGSVVRGEVVDDERP